MNIRSHKPTHPGIAVRAIIQGRLPKHDEFWVNENEFSVSAVAKILRIGRPALSNFLNCKAGLSVELASQIEKIFQYDREELLKMQLEYDLYKHDLIHYPQMLDAIEPFKSIKTASAS